MGESVGTSPPGPPPGLDLDKGSPRTGPVQGQGPPGGLKPSSPSLLPPSSRSIAPDLALPPLCWFPNSPGIPLAKSLLGSPHPGHTSGRTAISPETFPSAFLNLWAQSARKAPSPFQWEGSGKEMGSLIMSPKNFSPPEILGLWQAGDSWGQCAP